MKMINATATGLPRVSEYTQIAVLGTSDEVDAMLARLGLRYGAGNMQCWLGAGLHVEYRGTYGGSATERAPGYVLGLWPIGPTEQSILDTTTRDDDRTKLIGASGYVCGDEPTRN